MGEDRYERQVLRLLWAGLMAAAVWAGLRWVLPWLAPFLAAGVLAWLLEPAVGVLTVHCRLPRRWAALVSVLAAATLLGGGAALLAWRLWYELALLAGRLPALLAEAAAWAEAAEAWLYRLFVALPVQLRQPAWQAVEELGRWVTALPGWLGERAVGWGTGLLSALPEAGLFLFTTFLGACFLLADRPGLVRAAEQLPASWQRELGRWRQAVRAAAGDWLRVQGVLMLLTFGQLAVGLLALGVGPGVLLAGLIALVDALPIFGSGVVLLPWSLGALLTGRVPLGLGLAGLFLLVTVVRSALEPRLMGRRAGLPPLAALVCLYVGFQLFGVWGMLLAPVGVLVARELWLNEEHETRDGPEAVPRGHCDARVNSCPDRKK